MGRVSDSNVAEATGLLFQSLCFSMDFSQEKQPRVAEMIANIFVDTFAIIVLRNGVMVWRQIVMF